MSEEDSDEIEERKATSSVASASKTQTNGVALTDDEKDGIVVVAEEKKKDNNNIQTAPPQTLPKVESKETNPFEQDDKHEVVDASAKAATPEVENHKEKVNGNGLALENGVKATDDKKSDVKNNNGEGKTVFHLCFAFTNSFS